MADFDLLVTGGRWFDGTGGPSRTADVAIRDGRVVEVAPDLDRRRATRVIEAEGKWVLPGLVDNHTHYDAEVLLAPGLTESVRHGVTTITMGSCSLSTIHVTPEDAADIFSRVEALPRPHVLAALQDRSDDWDDAASYVTAIEGLPLGPNVAMYLGHSDLRASVMGLGRSVDGEQRPTSSERDDMRRRLEEALDAGFLGMSSMTNPWDKLDGERHRSRQLPSSYARFSEYRFLGRLLRDRNRIHQSAPNLTTKINLVLFYLASAGWFRRPLKTTIITAADVKSNPTLWHLFTSVLPVLNRLLRADLRWQHLPVPFEVYADGIDLVVFEEFGAGAAAIHLADEVLRNELLRDEAYRRRFRKQYEQKFTPRVWNRDFHDSEIVACPNAAVVGRSFGQVADELGIHPVDAFLDLVVEYGTDLRWRTTITNHRPKVLDRLSQQPDMMLGFSDAGAHLRNMAFYNFGSRFLARVLDRERRGTPIMSIEQAVHRLTGQLADWHGIDAGHLRVGDRADLCVVDPDKLDEVALAEYHEAPVEEFGGLSRMVNRGEAVVATAVAGNVVWQDGVFTAGYGADFRSGRFLRAEEPSGTVDPATVRAAPSITKAAT